MDEKLSVSYGSRMERNQFFADNFVSFEITKSILNIGGGGERHLAKAIQSSDVEVVEVDICGDSDFLLNLDQIDRLPFPDNSFDIVCAFDVLEHLENFHLVISEMVRVSRNKVVVSLPIGFIEIFDLILKREKSLPSEYGMYSKYYGLPVDPPSDRHRWFLTHDDIERFFRHFAQKKRARVDFFPRNNRSIAHRFLRLLIPNHIYRNVFCPFLWVQLTKTNV
tara:strand:+ start:1848 stop:2513 length:666 start_codon:yes stop_codon:yes gene_type:complete